MVEMRRGSSSSKRQIDPPSSSPPPNSKRRKVCAMALMSAPRSRSIKPSSSKTPPRRYDVFLSFRGKDVRHNFLEHLYRALCRMGILTFKDDDKLEDGETINDGLLEAIEDSRSSIVVLSKNYADSSSCLTELLHILECKRITGQVVYPVFYHVEPSEVRKQGGAFGEGFARACSKKEEKASLEKEEVKRWTEALVEVGNLKGWVYPDARFMTEANLIDDLVRVVFHKSIYTNHIFLDDLVGITSRMMQVIELLDLGSDETRVVGLWGMGGIGKTTLAKAVYDSIKCRFEGCCFIDDVTEVLNKGGVSALQEHLISDILQAEIKIRSAMHGLNIIQNNVYRKKVLIVLDNVSMPKQVEDLAGKLQYFGHGSRIIITTRDKHLLTVCGVRYVFNVQELNEHEAIQLFESKAFVENGKTEEFQRLVDCAVGYAKGVPLALKVFSSFLLGRTVPEWESALDRFRESPGDEVETVLRISYDGLHWTEKNIFLDIACFFRGKCKDQVINILDSCGFNAVIGINVLVKKSLLTISVGNRVLMHDLVQKMGWSVVDGGPRKESGERSRLWRPRDVKHVLMENTGTDKVEGMFLSSSENIQLRPDVFAKMPNLRFLSIDGASCSVNLSYRVRYLQWIFGDRYSVDLPNKLCYLKWDRYPFKCMPSTFQPEHLVELHLSNSCIEQFWDGTTVLPKLRFLDLSYSMSLTKSPEFTGFPNLEDLVLKRCTALVGLHPSIKKLKKLKYLNLSDCSSLQTLPCGIESQCLEVMIFSGCFKLNNISESFEDLKQLVKMDLDRTGITELPQSIGNFANLSFLNCSDCSKLESIPSSIGQLKKLQYLWLNGCSSLSELPEEVGLVDGVKLLHVEYSGVRQLPASIVRLKNLQELSFGGCIETPSSTSHISNSMPLELSSFSVCESLTKLRLINSRSISIPESVCLCFSLKYLHLERSDFESLPASIKHLSNLETLWVKNCKRLQELPELPPNVVTIWVSGCDSLKTICSLTAYRDARILGFVGCPKLVGNVEINVLLGYNFLSSQIKIKGIKCQLVNPLCYGGPGSKIPEWFSYQKVGGSLTFHMPILDLSTFNLSGFAFSAVVATKHRDLLINVKIRIGGEIFNLRGHPLCYFPPDSKNVFIIYYPIEFFTFYYHTCLTQMSAIVWEVYFVSGEVHSKRNKMKPAPKVRECGLHLFYKGELNEPLRLTE